MQGRTDRVSAYTSATVHHTDTLGCVPTFPHTYFVGKTQIILAFLVKSVTFARLMGRTVMCGGLRTQHDN